MSLIKVAWYVLLMKNMQFWSPSDPSQTATMQGEAELHILDFLTARSEYIQISSMLELLRVETLRRILCMHLSCQLCPKFLGFTLFLFISCLKAG